MQMLLFDLPVQHTWNPQKLLGKISTFTPINPTLKNLAESCFLANSDSYDFESLRIFSGGTNDASLQKWGIWSDRIVATTNVQCKAQIAGRRSLKDCLAGNVIPVKGRPDKGLRKVAEAPTIALPTGFTLDAKRGLDGGGCGFALLYRAADGDRVYDSESPTLRSLSASEGKRSGGTGATKVREFNGELYHDRPLLPEEAEALMGWPIGCTVEGISKTGDRIAISNTQRHKMLGNGIVSPEITEILEGLKAVLPFDSPTAGFLFAGGGGCTQGAINAGFNASWAVEYDKYAAAVYRARFPNTALYEADIRELDTGLFFSPDLIIWGSPCPDFSTAGKRAGIEGDRGSLFWEGLRFLRNLKPKAFIFENVAGLLSVDNGQTFPLIIDEFRKLGYCGTWQLRNANRHVPQNRQRIFCVGILQEN